MGAMAGSALGHFRKAEVGYLTMIRGPVGTVVMRMAAATSFHIVELELIPVDPQGAVGIMTVCAGRGQVVTPGHGLAMDALPICAEGSCVAFTARVVYLVAAGG